MRRANSADKDEQSEELSRLQLMLFELKTTRADLLEQLDDAQHEAEMLRQQLKKMQDA
jgi:predicted RNase H-like nuclease (RuvC/YqgF family)